MFSGERDEVVARCRIVLSNCREERTPVRVGFAHGEDREAKAPIGVIRGSTVGIMRC